MVRTERKRTELVCPPDISPRDPHGRETKKRRQKVSRLDTVEHKGVRKIMILQFLTK